MAKLDGKVALITGAAAGLGEGISTAYAKYGAKLIMVEAAQGIQCGNYYGYCQCSRP